jgi:hypothetical protein
MGLGRSPIAIKDQRGTLFCTAYGTAAASEYQEGIELSPDFQVAAVSRVAGAPILNGADPRDALNALPTFGSLAQHLSPFSLDTHGAAFVANLDNWPADLIEKAKEHAKAAYIRINGPHDTYDNIRNALYMGQAENQAVVAFGRWYRGWNNVGPSGIVPDDQSALHGYHCYIFIDWTIIDGVEYLVAQNSYGTAFGKGGLQYFSRKIVNEAWKPDSLWGDGIGLFILRDVSPETIAEQKRSLLFILAGVLLKIVTALRLYTPPQRPQPQPAPKPAPTPTPLPEPIKPVVHPHGWAAGTLVERKAMYQLAVRVCAEEGLPSAMTRDLLLTIAGESGFNQWCENRTTLDYGLCQFSLNYYCKEYRMTPQECIDQPERCLRIMARNFKAGRQSNWIAYKTRHQHAAMLTKLASA